jgi:hypothetical protein
LEQCIAFSTFAYKYIAIFSLTVIDARRLQFVFAGPKLYTAEVVAERRSAIQARQDNPGKAGQSRQGRTQVIVAMGKKDVSRNPHSSDISYGFAQRPRFILPQALPLNITCIPLLVPLL